MSKFLIYFSLVAFVGCFVYLMYFLRKVLKTHVKGETAFSLDKTTVYFGLCISLVTALMYSLMFLGVVLDKSWELKFVEGFSLFFGSLVVAASLCVGVCSFVLHYYRTDLNPKESEILSILWRVCVATLLFGAAFLTNGFADHIAYPLISGFDFSSGSALYGGEMADGFGIKFYGILIVCGALICYAITDHMTYKKFKKHGLIDTLFIVAFLAGVLGARLWYCIILEPGDYLSEPITIFTTIADGGLAIQGGAIFGIGAGVAFMLIFRKYIDVRFMMDVAVPTILIAQVMGRWGNFFNQEVYGAVCNESALWFLPKMVRNNMLILGKYRVPLFFIEGTINLCGYFFIRYFLGKVCKFHIGLGYQSASYLIWYGMVRAILEPLREGFTLHGHEGGFGYLQSWFIAFGMMVGGVVLLLAFYFIHKNRQAKGLENEFGDKIA